MFEIWDGDLYLYSVDTEDEADEQLEAGFTVKSLEYYGAGVTVKHLDLAYYGA